MLRRFDSDAVNLRLNGKRRECICETLPRKLRVWACGNGKYFDDHRSALTEQLLDVRAQNCRIQSRRRRDTAELVHPERRFGRRSAVPSGTSTEEQVHVPSGPRCRQDRFVCASERFTWIPVLVRPLVRYERCATGNVRGTRAEFWRPNDERGQTGICDLGEHGALNFERPSKTVWSSRTNEQQQTNIGRSIVERGT